MRYDEAARIRDRWLAEQEETRFSSETMEEMAEKSVAVTPRGVAMGILGRDDDYRVAVRIIDDSPATSAMVQAIRDEVGDEQLDIEFMGVAEMLSTRDTVRPLEAGLSCSRRLGDVGTMACFVRKRDGSALVFILSNAHVLLPAGIADQEIVQPAILHKGTMVVGAFFEAIPFMSLHNEVDAGLATLAVGFTQRVRDQGVSISRRRTFATRLQSGDLIYKVGAASERTDGVVRLLLSGVPVEVNGAVLFFDNQLEVLPTPAFPFFAYPGDSGSLVLDGMNVAGGLLFARNRIDRRIAYVNPIDVVFDRLQIELA